MNLSEYIKGIKGKELVSIIIKFGLSTAPFTGGISQLWSDIDSRNLDEKLDLILEYISQQNQQTLVTEEKEELRNLLKGRIALDRETAPNSKTDDFIDILRKIMLDSIPEQLRESRIEGRYDVDNALNNLLGKDIFKRELDAGIGKSIFLEDINNLRVKSNLFLSQFLGVSSHDINIDKYLKNPKSEINVAFTPIMLSASAIFFYLKYIKGFNLKLHYGFAHALELSEKIANGSLANIQACVFGDAPSLNIINSPNNKKFHFVSFMPKAKQKIVSPKVKWYKQYKPYEGEYTFIGDRISTTLIQFDEWSKRGIIDNRKVKTESREPHESIDILMSGNPDKKLLVWSPHWQIYQNLNIGNIIKTHHEDYWFDSLLFLKSSFMRNKTQSNAFLIEIKNAWFALLDPLTLKRTIDIMLSDEYFVELLKRYTGYYYLIENK